MSGDDPRFARIPARLLDELEAGEITFAGFALRVYLIGKTNHHTGRHVTTLAALRDLLGWPWGDQQLRKELRRLEPDFRVEHGQGRNRWTLHVQADDFGLEPAQLVPHFNSETPSDFEVTSNGGRPADSGNGAAMRARGPSALQTGSSPQPSTDADGDTDTEADADSASDKEAAAAQPNATATAIFNDKKKLPDPTDSVAVLVHEIRDTDDGTELVFRGMGLPEAAYRSALERLRERRQSSKRLDSEVRFVCHFLSEWGRPDRYWEAAQIGREMP